MSSPVKKVITQIVLEAEAKFAPTASSVAAMEANGGVPPFRTITRLKIATFDDVYYDRDDVLSQDGVWIRRRGPLWQAKVRHAGDYARSHFAEVCGPAEVNALLAAHLSPAAIDEGGEIRGVPVLARIRTFRREWLVNERFAVAVDDTDFGHAVGEVELLDEAAGDSTPAERAAVTSRLHADIDALMTRHAWAFPGRETTIGKLEAYLTRRKA